MSDIQCLHFRQQLARSLTQHYHLTISSLLTTKKNQKLVTPAPNPVVSSLQYPSPPAHHHPCPCALPLLPCWTNKNHRPSPTTTTTTTLPRAHATALHNRVPYIQYSASPRSNRQQSHPEEEKQRPPPTIRRSNANSTNTHASTAVLLIVPSHLRNIVPLSLIHI